MRRRGPLLTIGIGAAVGVALWLSTPPVLDYRLAARELPGDLDDWLDDEERGVDERFGLVEGTRKRIVWQTAGERTRYAVVYLHGFSATRQETAPLAARVADGLGANLFETRLAGHGYRSEPMHGVRAEQWLDDAAEAIAIGARLGERVVLIGTSTGGTLALAACQAACARTVSDIVLISPNFAPRDPSAHWATRPGGSLIARLAVGETRSWTPHNELQARYWSTTYPVGAAIEMMRLVDLLQSELPLRLDQNLLVFISPDDAVVSPAATRDAFAGIEAPRKQLVEITTSGDPSQHVLAGDVLSPGTTGEMAARIVAFITADASE